MKACRKKREMQEKYFRPRIRTPKTMRTEIIDPVAEYRHPVFHSLFRPALTAEGERRSDSSIPPMRYFRMMHRFLLRVTANFRDDVSFGILRLS
jgi:hypothetical protein